MSPILSLEELDDALRIATSVPNTVEDFCRRSDSVALIQRSHRALLEEVERLRGALAVYANEENWWFRLWLPNTKGITVSNGFTLAKQALEGEKK